MNKQELIEALKTKFYAVDEAGIHEGKTEAEITVWGIGVFDKVGDVVAKKNLMFYTKGTDAFWGVSEPNPPAPEPVITFTNRVNTFIASKITDGTIRFAYIEQISDNTQKALVAAIMSDKTEKKAIISEAADGTFSLEQL
ncbi:hypothetical protein KAT92_06560 [Candidatus Babeliales bacterium]|nr:hypothetical protein [Candidatus Babeliales bacterium]